MKRTILAIALVAALTMGLGSCNSADSNSKGNDTTQCDRGRHHGDKNPAAKINALLEGINITPEQRAAIDSLIAVQAPAPSDATQVPDSAACINKKAEMLAGIKAVLTPDQYVQFLENAFVQKPCKGPRGDKGPKGDKPDKGGKHGHDKGPRGDRK